jgi:hypothetical protein
VRQNPVGKNYRRQDQSRIKLEKSKEKGEEQKKKIYGKNKTSFGEIVEGKDKE